MLSPLVNYDATFKDVWFLLLEVCLMFYRFLLFNRMAKWNSMAVVWSCCFSFLMVGVGSLTLLVSALWLAMGATPCCPIVRTISAWTCHLLVEITDIGGEGGYLSNLDDCDWEAFVIDSVFNAMSLEVIGRLGREGVVCWKAFNVWKVWSRGGWKCAWWWWAWAWAWQQPFWEHVYMQCTQWWMTIGEERFLKHVWGPCCVYRCEGCGWWFSIGSWLVGDPSAIKLTWWGGIFLEQVAHVLSIAKMYVFVWFVMQGYLVP